MAYIIIKICIKNHLIETFKSPFFCLNLRKFPLSPAVFGKGLKLCALILEFVFLSCI